MSTEAAHTVRTDAPARTGAQEAYFLLRTVFTIAPILFGLDKFTNILTEWTNYLAPWIDNLMPGSASVDMMMVGVVEIIAGVLVWVRPKIGAYVVAAWLAGIILNLLTLPGFYDVALRDFGLFVAALALARLAKDHATK
ncbi:MAG: hypothetical protein Q4P07_12905 [Ornithinimicrobium sp.]|uniref:hypothetical protein n=1 Tax=Ornithinimicrobium sp. TaxID=1977084 RepID=UPI0026DFC87E|nr:hypothetical protein [Ornithinimicrobium sp.]MDO5741034.1 hypothetical protein [Ornithinimicrobium sp.]